MIWVGQLSHERRNRNNLVFLRQPRIQDEINYLDGALPGQVLVAQPFQVVERAHRLRRLSRNIQSQAPHLLATRGHVDGICIFSGHRRPSRVARRTRTATTRRRLGAFALHGAVRRSFHDPCCLCRDSRALRRQQRQVPHSVL